MIDIFFKKILIVGKIVSNSNLNSRRVTALYRCLFEFLFDFLCIGATFRK